MTSLSATVILVDDRPGAKPWIALFILLGLAVLSFLDRQIVALMVAPIRHDLGISDFQIGLLQGVAFGVFYAVLGLPFGWLADRVSRRWVIWGGVTIWSLATTASGLSHSFGHLFAARLFVAAGEAALSPTAYSLISDLFPRRKLAFALSIFATGATVGHSLAFALGGVLVDQLAHVSVSLPGVGTLSTWQLAFILLGLPGLGIALVAFLIPEPSRGAGRDDGRAGKAEFIDFLKTRRRLFGLSFIGFGLISTVGYGVLGWLPAFLGRHFGLSTMTIGFLLAVQTTLAGISGGVLSGRIVDALFARGVEDAHLRYWTVAALLCGMLGLLAFTAQTLTMFFIWAFLLQMLLPFTGVAAAMVQVATPERLRGRASALFILTFNLLGLGLGTPLVAAITDFVLHDDAKVGWSIALVSVTLSPVAALLFWLSRGSLRSALSEPAGLPLRAMPTR